MVSIATIQLHGWSGVRILVGANYFYLLQNVQTWGNVILLRLLQPGCQGPSIADIRVELYRYFPYVPSWRGYSYCLGAGRSGD